MSTWSNQPENSNTGTEFYLKIDDTNFFLIDNVFKLIIDNSSSVVWTNQQEN